MSRSFLSLGIACFLALVSAAPASAAFGLEEASVSFINQDGSVATQAGSHPFAMTTTLGFTTEEDADFGGEVPQGNAKNLRVKLPAGFVGNPTAMPYCATAELIVQNCPVTSEVGIIDVVAGGLGEPTPTEGVYNMAPPPGVAAKIGFKALTVPITVELRVNPDPPYNVVASLSNIPEVIPFYGSTLTVWGTPAEAAHDSERLRCGASCSLGLPLKPFITLPRSCPAVLTTLFEVASWEDPATWVPRPALTPGPSGCDKLGFSPRISAQPTSRSAESASGLDFELDVTDEGIVDPKGLARSDIEKAVVTFPEGFSANPSLAEGLATCSEADLANEKVGSEPGQGCPQAAKIGTLEAQTPILEGRTARGSLFIAEPYKNRFGTLLAIYATIREPELGILIKLAGKVEPDPRTGQLVSTFEDLPQFPVSHFHMHFREGGRSPLVTPSRCGTYETKAVLTPWANPAAPYTTSASFKVTSGVGGGPCPSGAPPFSPSFEAGTTNNAAGAYSPLSMRLTRRDGDQELTRFDSVLPPGVVGKIAGLAKCSDAAIDGAKTRTGVEELASPSCPPGSQIGRTLVGAGVGSELTYVPGKLYLGGPFGGHPLSVVAITPAVAGPFDAGTVVTRLALDLDPNTAEVQVDGANSDPIPHILKGIPLKIRDIRAYVDRQNFTLNSTSCEPTNARATIFGGFLDAFSSADDVSVSRSARYQAADCASLGFKPKLSLKLTGGTRRGAYPALKAVVTPRKGDANFGAAVVTLPHSAFLEQAHIGTICTRVQFAADRCPAKSVYGKARAISPLLDEPLAGPVYLRSSNNPLPDMVIALRGIFDVNLVSRIDSRKARIRSSFESIPDAPVSKFILEMKGGKKGLIVNSRNLCARTSRASALFTGQNGRRYELNPVVKATSCANKQRKAKRR